MEGKRLYVGNLPYSTNETQIREIFAPYGTVDSVKLIEQKGFGFVEMSTSEEAQNAMDSLNQTDFGGRTLRIDEARPMQPRREYSSGGSSGSYGGNRSYGSGGSGGSSGGYSGNRKRY
jgi:RNA recognition motif-containing protein